MDFASVDHGSASRLFSLSRVADAQVPVLVAVPHAGRDYPDSMLANVRVAPHVLEKLEDRHADLLLAAAQNAGCATLTAHMARAWLDLNRAPNEIDPQMIVDAPRTAYAQPSIKVRGGLGLVPRRLADHGELWQRPWPRADISARINSLHEPYHRTLALALSALRARFGAAVLIDLHSMPPLKPEGAGPTPQIVVGDRYGRSAGTRLCDLAVQTLARRGFNVTLNHPYAGGYVLERHGRPASGIHALQIEIDRSLYLDGALRDVGPGLDAVRDAIGHLVKVLSADVMAGRDSGDFAIAAE
jgi:N-formylglutamate amidohydrolase